MGGQLRSISSSMTKETEGGHVSPGSGHDWTEFWSNFTLTGKSSFNLQIHGYDAGRKSRIANSERLLRIYQVLLI